MGPAHGVDARQLGRASRGRSRLALLGAAPALGEPGIPCRRALRPWTPQKRIDCACAAVGARRGGKRQDLIALPKPVIDGDLEDGLAAPGAPALAVDDTHACGAALAGRSEELGKLLIGFPTGHAVQVEVSARRVVAAAQPPHDSYLDTGAAKAELVACLDLRRVCGRLEQGVDDVPVIGFPLARMGARARWMRLCAIVLDGLDVGHSLPKEVDIVIGLVLGVVRAHGLPQFVLVEAVIRKGPSTFQDRGV